MLKSWKWALVALPCLVAITGCSRAAVKYNNEVVGITKELENIGKQLGEDLARNGGNQARLQQLQSDASSKITEITKRGRAITPPSSAEGQAMHKAFLSYLDTEDDIATNDLPKLATIFASARQPEIHAFFNQIEQKEQPKVNALKQAQKDFAKANNLKIQ
jgi:hypothetical protein